MKKSHWIVSSITRTESGTAEARIRPVEWYAPTPDEGEPVLADPGDPEAFAIELGSSMTIALEDAEAVSLEPGDSLLMELTRIEVAPHD